MSQDAENVKVVSCTEEVSCVRTTSKYRWVVLLLIFAIYTIATADRANIGIAMPFIRKQFAMSNTEAGGIMSLFFLGYASSMIPGGFLNARFGVRRIFSVAMIATSLFTGLVGFAGSILQLKIFRLGVGLSEGPLAVGMPTTINNWFPAREKGFATGTFIASSKFGPLIVPPLCALIIKAWGWEYVFWAFALPGAVFAVLWYLLVTNHPSESRFCSAEEAQYIASDTKAAKSTARPKKPYTLWWLDKIIRARKVEPIDTTAKVFLSWDMIGSSLGYFFMVAITTTMMSWIPTYLTTVKKFAIMKMAFASAAPFAGAVLGNMVGGWLSDNVLGKRRKPLMIVSSLTTSLTMYSLINSPADPFMLGSLLFLLGFLLALGFSAFVVYPMGLVTKDKFPIATSITNTGGQLGGFCAPLAVGWILDKYNWDMVFTTLAVGCIVCFMFVLTIVEPIDEPAVRS